MIPIPMAVNRNPPVAPDALPDWMLDLSEQDQEFQLGSANSDQFAVGGWGTQNRPNEADSYWTGHSRDLPLGTEKPPIASMALQQALSGGTPRATPPSMGAPSGETAQSAFSSSSFYPKEGYVGMGEGGLGTYKAPSGMDRVGRALKGFAQGPDTGSRVGNAALRAGSALVPGGKLAAGAAGAIQGARSDQPDFDKGVSASSSTTPTKVADPAKLAEGIPRGRMPLGDQGETFAPSPGGFGTSLFPSEEEQFGGGPSAEAAPGAEEADPTGDALAAILAGGQTYATDGAGGRRGVAGAGSGYDFAGFDFAQDPGNRDIGKSAKYAFAHLASQAAAAGAPAPRTKAEAEAWFSQYIAPGMNELGFTVHKVVGDKAFISAPEHPQGAWVDFVIGADGGGPTPLAWQAELGGAGADADPEALFAVLGGGAGGGEDFGMARGASPGGVLDSGNSSLDSFAQQLIQNLLKGAALEDTLGQEGSTFRGVSPRGLKAVGF